MHTLLELFSDIFNFSTDFSDDEGEESEKDKEEPEEWGKFLHLKERVRIKII